jgi:hypothetical protein
MTSVFVHAKREREREREKKNTIALTLAGRMVQAEKNEPCNLQGFA